MSRSPLRFLVSSVSSSSGTDDTGHSNGPEDEFSQAQQDVLVVISIVLSCFSLLGSLFIVATNVVCSEKVRTFAFKLILSLALANIGLDVAYCMGEANGGESAKCQIQAFMRVYFALVGFGLVTAITLACYQMIIRNDYSIKDKLLLVNAICWGVPAVMAALPYSTDSYGRSGAWCTITSDDLKSLTWGTVWRFGVLYVPLWLCIIVNFVMVFKVTRAAKGLEAAMKVYQVTGEETTEGESRRSSGSSSQSGGGSARPSGGTTVTLTIINRLRMYSIILLVCWSWASVNRIYETIDPYNPQFWMYVLQYSFQTIQGLCNAIVFGTTPTVVKIWDDKYQQWRRAGLMGGGGGAAAVGGGGDDGSLPDGERSTTGTEDEPPIMVEDRGMALEGAASRRLLSPAE